MAGYGDGGPAFPAELQHVEQNKNDDDGPDWTWVYSEKGMSLRDWFAGQALSALIGRHRADVAWSEVAPIAYQIADDMIAESWKRKP